jgi:hypothetical protein
MTGHGRAEGNGGFSVLDGAAMVLGAAVASMHLRGVLRGGLADPGWAILWGAFVWIALTASGPFLFLVRRFGRRPASYPKVGDVLWALLGLPWVVAVGLHTPRRQPGPPHDDLFAVGLGIGLGLACLCALTVLWPFWVAVSREQATQTFSGPWTNRVGLLLALAWPIQCGLGMVVIG